MNRQYIGARYVPTFFNNNGNSEWMPGVSYEALTIVTHLGNSYTSKKPVPSNIGEPNTNTEYWVNTGNFNAQLEQLINSVSNNAKVTNRLANKKIIVIGDSYGTTNGSGEKEIIPYPFYLKMFLGMDDEHFMSAHKNGAGFGNGEFINLLNSFNNDEDVTDVYVFGGWNDIESRFSESVVVNNMKSFSNICSTKFPNAKKHLGLLCYGYEVSEQSLSDFNKLATVTYGQSIRNANIEYLNTELVAVQRMEDFWADINTEQGKTHPSTIGSIYIAIRLANTILSGNAHFYFEYNSEIISDNPNLNIVASGIFQTTDGNMITTETSKTIEITGDITVPNMFSTADKLKLGKLPNSISLGHYEHVKMACELVFQKNSVYKNASGILCLKEGCIFLSCSSDEIVNATSLHIVSGVISTNRPY
jgi:hypothetical protein